MTRSLAEDLRVLAHSGRGADDANPGAMIAESAGYLVRRIRRRRAARQTGMGALGVTAIAAVALGGTQGAGWLAGVGDHVGPGDEPSVEPTTDATDAPTATPTPGPTEEPAVDPTIEATPPSEDSADPALPAGLALVADRYAVDLSCGAAFTFASQSAAGAAAADHLTPRFDGTPTSATEPVHIVNEYGRDTPGTVTGGWARMTQAVVVTRDGLVVGFGGGTVRDDGSMSEVSQEFDITLPGLQMCPTPETADLVYTVYGISSEAGYDGLDRTAAPSSDEERLTLSWGLSIDLATGEQWFGEPADRGTSVRDGLTPMG
jgi:hypothetical protein